ncbi:hypothetical protein OAF27_00645 [Verrucomicrobiales bacterium]|nr:hypothetical protein [Verrucomicrobiales bacterium]
MAGAFLSCTMVPHAAAEPASSPPKEAPSESGNAMTNFTSEEREKLRIALSNVLNDPKVIAARDRTRSAMETYKAELRDAVKRTSPELGEKVEKMLLERLVKSDRDIFVIRFRSLFKPMKEIPVKLRPGARRLFSELGKDPTMERLKRESIKTKDVPGRSRIFGEMRTRIAELIEKEDPALFEFLQPLPGTLPHSVEEKLETGSR